MKRGFTRWTDEDAPLPVRIFCTSARTPILFSTGLMSDTSMRTLEAYWISTSVPIGTEA